MMMRSQIVLDDLVSYPKQMDGGDLPWWGGYGGLWRVIGRPRLGPAKSQGHERQEGIENAETGYGTVLSGNSGSHQRPRPTPRVVSAIRMATPLTY
jgi:hypothetical protein